MTAAASTSKGASAPPPTYAMPIPELDSLLLLEQPFAKVPYEDLRRRLRQHQRVTESQFASIQATVRDLDKCEGREELADRMTALIERVKAIKDKLQPVADNFESSIKTLSQRTQHLQELHQISAAAQSISENDQAKAQMSYQKWSEIRLQRMVTDWLLRRGYVEAAEKLVGDTRIEYLTDLPLFKEIIAIRSSLIPTNTSLQQPSCTLALSWCTDNKAALRRIKSPLEFDIRVQEFVELCRNRSQTSLIAAITYLRRHLLPLYRTAYAALQSKAQVLSNNGDDAAVKAADPDESRVSVTAPTTSAEDAASEQRVNQKIVDTVGRVTGLLAIGPGGWAYEEFYSASRYKKLYDELLSAAFHIYSLPPQPILHIALSAGLSSLKVPACYKGERSTGVNIHSSNGDSANVDEELRRDISSQVQAETEKHEAEAVAAALAVSGGNGDGRGGRASPLRNIARDEMKNDDCPVCATVRLGGDAAASSSSGGDGSSTLSHHSALGLGVLAREVPWSHHSNSTIVCRISGRVIDDSHSGGGGAVALPNGRVYSKDALEKTAPPAGRTVASSESSDHVVCPRTRMSYHKSSMRRVFIT